jgi:hypothetical protein
MTKIGKFWTDSIAYIALLVSAGLSLAGNVVDTYRIRGAATDALDIWLAITWPGLVVLMVHVFVSARWIGLSRWMQALRWLGCLSVGAVAMRASWIHLHDLLASRGQVADVAMFGPLAIDFLAIMSTALILAGRTRGHVGQVATAMRDGAANLVDTLATGQDYGAMAKGRRTLYVPDMDNFSTPVDKPVDRPVASAQDVATSEAIMANPFAFLTPDNAPDMDTDNGLDTDVASEASSWLATLDMARQDTSSTPAFPVHVQPVSPAAPSNRVQRGAVPADALDALTAWWATSEDIRPGGTEVDAWVAAEAGVSTRTARRWRMAWQPARTEPGYGQDYGVSTR